MIHDPVDLMRSGENGEAAKLDGAIANGGPAGIRPEIALKVDKILVDGGGMFGLGNQRRAIFCGWGMTGRPAILATMLMISGSWAELWKDSNL
jgi:hypothetical protein